MILQKRIKAIRLVSSVSDIFWVIDSWRIDIFGSEQESLIGISTERRPSVKTESPLISEEKKTTEDKNQISVDNSINNATINGYGKNEEWKFKYGETLEFIIPIYDKDGTKLSGFNKEQFKIVWCINKVCTTIGDFTIDDHKIKFTHPIGDKYHYDRNRVKVKITFPNNNKPGKIRIKIGENYLEKVHDKAV